MEKDTVAVLKEFSKNYRIVLATNGIASIQKERTEMFRAFVYRMYTSGEMGVIKPSGAFFRYVLDGLGCPAKRCLMIGDSVENDMTGAKRIGMDVCLYDPYRKNAPRNAWIDHVIEHIRELMMIL